MSTRNQSRAVSPRAAGTRAIFIDRYNSLQGRDALHDPKGRQRLERSLKRCMGSMLPDERDAAILDVGCGEGALLGLLAKDGYRRLSGFDLSAENVALCRDGGLDFVRVHDVETLDAFEPGRRYRVIFLCDVIEHLPKENAVPLLRAVRDRLEPGGWVVARTPNMGSLLGALERYGDLTHEWGLTERSGEHLFVAAGFARRDVEIGPAWEAATRAGRIRERYLRLLHRLVYLSAGRARPRIATPNLLVRAVAR
jgi:2-polyprenyl-3-methyl-5-hydroxy-6-metoxy-1,4-benzoquinol methylase